MIRHLLNIIWNQRKRNAWILAELLLVFVVLWFVVDTLYVVGSVYYRPLGMDLNHVYLLNYGVEEVDETDTTTVHPPLGEDLLTVVERTRTCPGVEAVATMQNSMPFSGQNSYSYLFMPDTSSFIVKYERVTADFFDVFGIQKSAGERRSWKEMLSGGQSVYSSDLLANIKKNGGDMNTILHLSSDMNIESVLKPGGVTAPFRETRFSKDAVWLFNELTDERIAKIKGERVLAIAFRVKPEDDPNFANQFMEKMSEQLSVGRVYLVDVTPYSLQRDAYEYLEGEKAETQKQLVIMSFLLFNIFLGIIGTFWFRTEHRKGEMGLRVALGSTRVGLQWIMMLEGLLLLSLVAIPAFLICFNLQLAELTKGEYLDYTFLRFLTGFAITYALMAVMIMLGIWYPARQTAHLEPAEALHYE